MSFELKDSEESKFNLYRGIKRNAANILSLCNSFQADHDALYAQVTVDRQLELSNHKTQFTNDLKLILGI